MKKPKEENLIWLSKARDRRIGIRIPSDLMKSLDKEREEICKETGMKLSISSYIILKLSSS